MNVSISEIASHAGSDLYPPLVVVTFEHQPYIDPTRIAVRFSRVRQVISSVQQTPAATSAEARLSAPPLSADTPVAWNVWISPEADDAEAVRGQIITVANEIANA